MTRRPSIWPVLLAALVGIVVLCGLGTWQVQRLTWKQSLIATLNARLAAGPVPLNTVVTQIGDGTDIEFLKVTATGRWLAGEDKLMLSALDGRPAWEVVTPFATTDGHVVLVDRGHIPDEMRQSFLESKETATADVDLTGILRRHAAGRDTFSPNNNAAANSWYWWDVPAMMGESHLAPDLKSLPVVIHLLPTAGDQGYPRPPAPGANLRNSHLQYAVTWYSLAAVLAVIAGLYLRGQARRSDA